MLFNTLLTLALLSTGLFAGLMLTLVVLMQRQWNMLEKEEYVRYFKGFLLIAKGNPIITLLTIASFVLPIACGVTGFFAGNQARHGYRKGIKIEISLFAHFKRQVVPDLGCFQFSFLFRHIRSPRASRYNNCITKRPHPTSPTIHKPDFRGGDN